MNLEFCNAGSLGARTTENFETKVDRKASGVLISQTVGGWPLDALGKAAEPNVSLLTRQEREHTIDRFCANHVFEDASSESLEWTLQGPHYAQHLPHPRRLDIMPLSLTSTNARA